MPDDLKKRLKSVEARIAEAAARSGRLPEEVTLLPVTKTVPSDGLQVLPSLGYRSFGENRLQEIQMKSVELAGFGVSWQMIGRLQTKKAGQVARLVDMVQSVDSLRLAESLSRGAVAADRGLEVLLQVNTSGEESKAGLRPEEVPSVLESVSELPNLTLRGFMTMAPLTADQGVVRSTFARLRELRDSFTGVGLPVLSMGMSHDFETAIEEGATLVRVGSAIFGERPATATVV